MSSFPPPLILRPTSLSFLLVPSLDVPVSHSAPPSPFPASPRLPQPRSRLPASYSVAGVGLLRATVCGSATVLCASRVPLSPLCMHVPCVLKYYNYHFFFFLLGLAWFGLAWFLAGAHLPFPVQSPVPFVSPTHRLCEPAAAFVRPPRRAHPRRARCPSLGAWSPAQVAQVPPVPERRGSAGPLLADGTPPHVCLCGYRRRRARVVTTIPDTSVAQVPVGSSLQVRRPPVFPVDPGNGLPTPGAGRP